MSNLFFVHTPFQLFVAQQIINQEKLGDNILIYGYINGNKHFLDIYNLIIVDSCWKCRYYMESINSWSLFSFNSFFHNYSKALENRKFLNTIIKTHDVNVIYVGDANNVHYQLLSCYYSRKNLSIYNYEEGSTHYYNITQISKFANVFIRGLKAVVSDIIYYIPIWQMPFGKNVYLKTVDYKQLPFSRRYSIIPFFHDSIDVRLYPSILINDRLRVHLNNELMNVDISNSLLFLSEPVDEYTPLKYKLELLSIEKYFSSYYNNETVTIKFHPREDREKKECVLSIFKKLQIPYVVISKDINIPIEYYLQYVRYNKIVTYMCSTVLYNGYLYPKTEVFSLLPIYYDYCVQYKSAFRPEVERLLASNMYKIMFDNGK